MENFGKFCAGLLMLILAVIIGGFVFMKFWSWFIVPTFALPALSFLQSVGISWFVSYIKSSGKKSEYDMKELPQLFLIQTVYTATILLIGWIIFLLI